MEQFYKGFNKYAQLLSKLDSQGGVAPRDPEEIAAAQAVDLLTLPKSIEGAACANCRFMKVFDKKTGSGMCQNPNVLQEVTERMHCNQWDGMGTLRNWDAIDEATNIPMGGQAAEIGPDGMPMDDQQQVDPATGQPVAQDPAAGGAEQAASAEKKPAKKEKKEKPEAKGGHEININVGSKAMDKKAFMAGFDKEAGAIAGGLGRAMGAIKGTATKAGKGIQQIGRSNKLDFRVGQKAGIEATNPALARSIRSKTNPTKSPAPAVSPIKNGIRNAAIAGTAIAGGAAAGVALGSRASKDDRNAS